jgi:integration host factor subunit alpha
MVGRLRGLVDAFMTAGPRTAMTPKTITREHLYDAVYKTAGLSRAEAATLVELVLEEIAACLERGEAVKLSAFGSFIVRQKSQRMGRNPKTGRPAPIPAGRVVVFKPSPVLRKRINAGAEGKLGSGGD